MKELSVVITVLNEEENIKPLLESIHCALKGIDYEIVIVDDGSTDKTKQQILNFADSPTLLIELRKNYGQTTAMAAGIDYSNGKYIALLDGDLQNDPADIPAMLQLLQKGDWDVVAGNRKKRKDRFFLRKISSDLANSLIRRATGVNIRDYGCTLKIFRREIAEELNLYGELHRFIPVLAKMHGARITQVDIRHHARKFGKSKYGMSRGFRVLPDLMLVIFFRRYFQKPMHFFGGIGLISVAISAGIGAYLLYLKLGGHVVGGNWLLIAGLIFFLGGLQLIAIGVLAEICIRVYFESQNKKTYAVRKVYHVKQDEKISV